MRERISKRGKAKAESARIVARHTSASPRENGSIGYSVASESVVMFRDVQHIRNALDGKKRIDKAKSIEGLLFGLLNERNIKPPI
jgi:hypothetical protein